jgi:multiple sugar transport system ATP-binding protein
LLGDATLVTVRSGESLVTVKAGKAFRGEIGEAIGFDVPATICHLFDATSGERLPARVS